MEWGSWKEGEPRSWRDIKRVGKGEKEKGTPGVGGTWGERERARAHGRGWDSQVWGTLWGWREGTARGS